LKQLPRELPIFTLNVRFDHTRIPYGDVSNLL
jgi:hypothetical protein